MKHVLENTHDLLEDEAQLQYATSLAIADGYTEVFTPTAIAWRTKCQYHFEVANSGEYSWTNSKGNEVVVFLLEAGTKGYHTQEFDQEYLRGA